MKLGPVRRLPITSPPAPYETFESYINRLERLNHLGRGALMAELATMPAAHRQHRPVSPDMIDIKRLSVMAGYPLQTLQRAMPHLRNPQPRLALFQPDHYARPCRRCVRHRGGVIWCQYPMHHFVCLRHKVWVGSRVSGRQITYDTSSPIDVSSLPEVLAAQRHLRRLTRRHGELAMARALRLVQDCLDEWMRRSPIWGVQKLRLDALLGPDWERVNRYSLTYTISTYPEMVGLAGVLASPQWRTLAANPTTRPQFLEEIGRQRSDWSRRRSYPEPSRGDPLHDWLISIQ